jgi:orotate phosphoribosyltransferase-like protein
LETKIRLEGTVTWAYREEQKRVEKNWTRTDIERDWKKIGGAAGLSTKIARTTTEADWVIKLNHRNA